MLLKGHRSQAGLKRGVVTLFYHGFHCVRFDGTYPLDSKVILWDNRTINTETLVGLLRFDIDAGTLRPREDRSHHKADPVLNEAWV